MTPFFIPGCFQFLEDPNSADPFLEWYGRYDERSWRPFRRLARLVHRSEPTPEPRCASGLSDLRVEQAALR